MDIVHVNVKASAPMNGVGVSVWLALTRQLMLLCFMVLLFIMLFIKQI